LYQNKFGLEAGHFELLRLIMCSWLSAKSHVCGFEIWVVVIITFSNCSIWCPCWSRLLCSWSVFFAVLLKADKIASCTLYFEARPSQKQIYWCFMKAKVWTYGHFGTLHDRNLKCPIHLKDQICLLCWSHWGLQTSKPWNRKLLLCTVSEL
jgi:hypothetical protein